MLMLVGQYHIKIDKRRRFRIPSVFFKEINGEPLIIEKNLYHPCLDISTLTAFENKMDSLLSKINEYDKKQIQILEIIYSNAFPVEANKQIIHLPLDFFEYLQLKKESDLVIFGMGNSLRIIAKSRNEAKQMDKNEFLKMLKDR